GPGSGDGRDASRAHPFLLGPGAQPLAALAGSSPAAWYPALGWRPSCGQQRGPLSGAVRRYRSVGPGQHHLDFCAGLAVSSPSRSELGWYWYQRGSWTCGHGCLDLLGSWLADRHTLALNDGDEPAAPPVRMTLICSKGVAR